MTIREPTPTVSVIIPCYNAAPYVAETLRSVLSQTWARLEVIVVDDGSTDASAEIIRSFADERISLAQQSNKGQTAALNAGLANATGDDIQYLDEDDLLHPEKIELQLAHLSGRDRCVATSAWARFYRSPADAIFEARPNWKDLEPLEWFHEDWRDGGSMMFPAIWLIPMDVAKKAGPWDEALTLNNDAEYFTRVILQAEEILFCGDARAYYRSGLTGSLSGLRTREGWVSQARVLEACQEQILQRECSERMRLIFCRAWQQLAQNCYPYSPDIANEAISRARDLHARRFLPIGDGLFGRVAGIVGWRAARRLQRLVGRA